MHEAKLRIGIPVREDSITAGLHRYFDAVAALGAQGVQFMEDCPVDELDGLLLPGGGDMDPALYGQENIACQGRIDRELDDARLRAMDAFVRAGKPVLGVCLGHQFINVYFGGTLIQHLPSADRHSWDEIASRDKVHASRAERGCLLYELYGEEFPVNSAHHQAIDRLGEGLRVVQWSDDGVIEAVVHREFPVIGVQWHPERMGFAMRRDDTVNGEPVLGAFLDMCRERAE